MSTAADASTAVDVALSRLPELEQVGVALALPAGSIDVNGLRLTNPATTFDEWQQYGHVIGAFGRWHRFALGDWLLFGEAIFGEESAQAVESTASERYDVAQRVTGLQIETLRNYVRICQLVPLPIRRVELDFSIHEAVAALDREDQIYWLAQAVENGWDRASLRQAIKDAKNPPADDDVDVLPPADPPMTRYEQLQEAAARVFHQAQPTSEGGALVPAEPWSAFCAALGEE
jgi:hypothetical protein